QSHRVNGAVIQMSLELPASRRKRFRAEVEDVLRPVEAEKVPYIRAAWSCGVNRRSERRSVREHLNRQVSHSRGNESAISIRELKLHRHGASQLENATPIIGDGRQETDEVVNDGKRGRLGGGISRPVGGGERESVGTQVGQGQGAAAGNGIAIKRGFRRCGRRERVGRC